MTIEYRDVQKKFAWAWYIVLGFFLLAGLRFFYIQFINADKLQAEIMKNRVREIVDLPERGEIRDRNGNILAMSLITYDVAMNPNLILNPKQQEKVAKVLSDNIDGLKYDDVLKQIKSRAKYKVVGRQVPPDKIKKIKEAKLGGIQVSQSPKRLYPNDDLGGTVLGFVNNNSDPGAGVEIKMNKYLAGQKGYTLAEINPYGQIIPVGSQNTVSPFPGQNITLTIDSYMQHVVEENLKKTAEVLKPTSIQAVLMDPSNGQVLAMASYPSFNPNEYQKFDSKTYTNTPANFTYEPGSIIKPLIMAGALDYGTITGDEIYPSGSMTVSGHTVRDWNHGGGWGMIGLKDIIAHSSNVGMIHIGNTMTSKQTVDYFKKIGFNKPTGVELPGEGIGYNFPTEKALNDDPLRKANVSFGQGISVNAVQMVTALSEVANGGKKITPTLIHDVTDVNGNVIYKPEQPTGERIFKPETAEKVRGYLKNNMSNGSGAEFQIPGYDGGGKTGSAWFVENGRYKPNAIIGSFVGFLPYENPKYILLVSVKEPKGVEFGSTAAGPTFQNIMTEITRYKNLPHTTPIEGDNGKEKKAIEYKVKNYDFSLFEDAKADIEKKFGSHIKVAKRGQGDVVVDQTYSYKGNILTVEFFTKKINDNNIYYIPNLIGKNKDEVEQILKANKVPYFLHGNNNVAEMSLAPGIHHDIKTLQLWCD